MTRRRPYRWDPAQTWDICTQVVSAQYGIDVAMIRAPSRGRGPRPLGKVWWPKKMAVYLTVLVSGCDRAELGRLIGLHRDTVASHCADMQKNTDEDTGELVSMALERIVRARLERNAMERLGAERARFSMLEETTRELLTVLRNTTSSDGYPTEKGGVIRRISGNETVIDLEWSERPPE